MSAGQGAGSELRRHDEPIPELGAIQDVVACAAVFMSGLLTHTNRYPTAHERLVRALDAVVPRWRDHAER